MREQYWNFYYKTKYQFFYYKRFYMLFTRVNHLISIFCGLTSLSCVAAWGIWNVYPVLWSVLICLAQIIQALTPKVPYNDLLVSTKFMICSLDTLLLDIDIKWLDINYVHDYSDEEILQFIENYQKQHTALINQFFSGTYLPELKICVRKATEECNTYFQKYLSN